uniref:Uncharacterized protein n=1 Tax=Kalanchoe fedtschenkoi TaxID=63787 RepID=A0A7N0RG20_KALFE
MGRAPCCDKNGLKKGPWTPEEDQKLVDYIQQNGYGNWRTLPKNAGLQRCGKSCRLRWTNYLRPDIKRGRFSFEEEETIIQLHSILGNKWSAIAARLPGRTDNEIKNYWNTHIRKRLLRMGIDPVTHSPRLDLLDLSSILTSNLYNNPGSDSHMANISRLLAMHSSSGSINPELLRIATSLVHDPVGNYYAPAQLDPLDPTRMIPDQVLTQHHSLSQIQALQQQMAGYGSTGQVHIAESNLSDDHRDIAQDYVPMMPFNGFYNHGSEQSALTMPAEQSSSAAFRPPNAQNFSMNSVMSTPSSSPTHFKKSHSSSNVYINSSCTSTEDERDNHTTSNSAAADNCSNLMMMMKFEMPEIFDVSEFIY